MSFSRATPGPARWMITGVSSGLGRALAVAALARGDVVAGTLRSQAALEDYAALFAGPRDRPADGRHG